MSERVASSEVEVAVDPVTAFTAFTDEMDLWWVRGPINFSNDSGRVVEVRCEPGVGGRIGEVLDDPVSGTFVPKSRITTWEPGARLAWKSEDDDVRTEVRFVATDSGTRVVVEHRIAEGGADRGGTAWSRVVPLWFGAWCARREGAPREQRDIARLGLALYYEKPGAAARWLAEVFQLEIATELPTEADPLPRGEHGAPWIEFHAGNASIMVFELGDADVHGGPTHVPWVYVDDLDAHKAHVIAHGATIVEDDSNGWLRTYVVEDVEGRHWTFTQARPTQR